MADLNNTFIQGVMNKDLDERLVPQGQYRDALNITVETSEGSNVGAAQNSLGNTLVGNLANVSGRDITDARCIGAVTYEAENKIYYFIAADYFDGIYEYNADEDTTVRVLQCNKTNETTPSTLNFRKEYLITGVNHIIGPNGNNFLYWTDDYNPPRRVNIKRVIADVNGNGGYSIDDDRISSDIDVILEPPLYAPHIELSTDDTDTESNNMKEKFLYFAYRYQYLDNEYSSLSPFSAVAFAPDEYEYDYGVGNNKSMTNIYNQVKISFETGNEFVKAVQVVVRDTRSLNVSIIDTFKKENLDGYNATGDSAHITFKNSKVLAALSNDQVVRLFDNVPLLAKAQDVIGNRLAYGNYVQFRDIIDCVGDEIDIDFSLRVKTPQVDASVSSPKTTWHSDRDYEFALLYTDEYGRMTTALTCEDNSIYINPDMSVTSNQIVMEINHEPPCWATHYRIAVKESKGNVYNVFPLLYYVSGVYRYFYIHQSDVDKFSEGDYIIFKNDAGGPTLSNKKYKIIEAAVKNTDFLGTGSQIAGYYIKIKADSQSEFPAGNQYSFNLSAKNRYGTSQSQNAFVDGVINYPKPTYVEYPIHYGTGNPNAVSLYGTVLTSWDGNHDARVYVEIVSQTQYKYTIDKTLSPQNWVGPLNISAGSNAVDLTGASPPAGTLNISFDTSSALTVGDRWVFNCRANDEVSYTNYYGGSGINTWGNLYRTGAIVTEGFSTTSEPNKIIYPGAVIRISCVSDSENPSVYTQVQPFTSNDTYENIEEWFNESGAWQQFIAYDNDGTNVGAEAVNFRRGVVTTIAGANNGFSQKHVSQGTFSDAIDLALNGPLHMIIMGYGNTGQQDEYHTVEYKIEVYQSDTPIIFETSPKSTDAEIYHELSQTYPIENGNHIVLWAYDDYGFKDGGYTRLTQLDNRRPHYFNVGDTITVTHDGGAVPDADYTIVEIENRYSVVIDLAFPGAGPAEPGIISLANSDSQDQDTTTGLLTPAIIEINNPYNYNCDYNAWSWGNGLESNRIYDDFNETTLGLSPRATTVIDNYKQIRNDASICYSGVYNENTQYNRLNEFNLGLSNFKYLDREFGSIQKLYARNTDLLAFQENKLSKVLYGKNILTDSVGGGQVVSVPEVLGQQVTFEGEYGISKNPESFAQWGNQVFFTDARRGVVMGMDGNQLYEISAFGMRDYFRDLMVDNPTTQKLGAYDPHNHNYVLASTSQRVLPCALSISRTDLRVPKNGPIGYLFFDIITDVAWTLAAVDTGDGTAWVSDYATSGSGSNSIYGSVAANLTSSNRSVNLVVTYCDGLTETFTLTQGKGKKGKLVPIVFNSIKK